MFDIQKLDPANPVHDLGWIAYSTAKDYHAKLAAADVRSLTMGTPYEQTHHEAIAGNYGCGVTTIEGIEGPFVAFSALQDEQQIALFEGIVFPKGIVVRFKGEADEQRNFKVLHVNRKNEVGTGGGYFPRYHDSEAKILEKLYDELKSRQLPADTKGAIHLYTYYYPCSSCEYVANQFQDPATGYPQISIRIYYEISTSRNRGRRRVVQ